MANWTFGQRIGAGFAAIVLLTLLSGLIAIFALTTVVQTNDTVVKTYGQNLVLANQVGMLDARRSVAVRGFLLTRQAELLDAAAKYQDQTERVFDELRKTALEPEEQDLLKKISDAIRSHRQASDEVIQLRKGGAAVETVAQQFEDEVRPLRQQINDAMDDFQRLESQNRDRAMKSASSSASWAIGLVVVCLLVVFLLATFISVQLTRSLSYQIGSAVGRVQSSSSELQSVANQQATGAKEQATAMSEIATTISELLATSRQIAESAQRVASIADQTAGAANAGDGTVTRASESIGGIRRQVDQIVNHMLELGRKSQQIGSVLDIVSELSEQTNILAINATIEAAGAGESGKRFAVVADEIRKLADRVSGSTKEIRGLIEDVRNAVNTTVMATETGSKAVDSGNRQFGEVAQALRQISALVSTTTDAAREIELSTKQQTSAVEQVNVAIANVAQASRETEASTAQTLQTAQQLTGLSTELLRVVHR